MPKNTNPLGKIGKIKETVGSDGGSFTTEAMNEHAHHAAGSTKHGLHIAGIIIYPIAFLGDLLSTYYKEQKDYFVEKYDKMYAINEKINELQKNSDISSNDKIKELEQLRAKFNEYAFLKDGSPKNASLTKIANFELTVDAATFIAASVLTVLTFTTSAALSITIGPLVIGSLAILAVGKALLNSTKAIYDYITGKATAKDTAIEIACNIAALCIIGGITALLILTPPGQMILAGAAGVLALAALSIMTYQVIKARGEVQTAKRGCSDIYSEVEKALSTLEKAPETQNTIKRANTHEVTQKPTNILDNEEQKNNKNVVNTIERRHSISLANNSKEKNPPRQTNIRRNSI